jgi:hypothetical protein
LSIHIFQFFIAFIHCFYSKKHHDAVFRSSNAQSKAAVFRTAFHKKINPANKEMASIDEATVTLNEKTSPISYGYDLKESWKNSINTEAMIFGFSV